MSSEPAAKKARSSALPTHEVKDMALAGKGRELIELAERNM